MKKSFICLLAALSFLACGLGDTPRKHERLGTAKSAITVIDTTPEGGFAVLDLIAAPTIGTVFTVPANDPRPLTLGIRMGGSPTPLTVRGELYAWDGAKATGANLYESTPRSTSGLATETVTFDLSALDPLVPGQPYVFFLTALKDPNVAGSFSSVGVRSDDPYAGGVLVFAPANPADWTTMPWTPQPGSDVAMILALDQVATTTSLAVTAGPTVFGQTVTLTATVTGHPNVGAPAGSVEFFDGATSLGSANLAAGQATVNAATLAVGSHSFTAVYGANGPYFGSTSSPAVSHAINKAATTTTVMSSADPSAVGAQITFTANVSANAPGAGTPGGTVTFKDAAATLGTGTLDLAGVATFQTAALIVGPHPITAEYGGNGSFLASTSVALAQDVVANAATIALVTGPSPSVYGGPITLEATITGSGAAPTGTVTFKEGAIVLGTGPLAGTGIANVPLSGLGAGTHLFSVEYSGDATYASGTGNVQHVVNKAPTTTTLVSAMNPAPAGVPVRFTAAVTSSVPGVSGTVTFFDGAEALGTSPLVGGTATVVPTFTLRGTHAISATFLGSPNFSASNSAAIMQNVTPPLPDAGAPEAGTPAGTPGDGASTGGGGGCRLGATRTASGGTLFVVLASALLVRRRRGLRKSLHT